MPFTKRPPEPWDSFLKDLDAAVDAPVRLDCIGGFVVTQLYGLDRPTADVDVIELAHMRQPKPSCPSVCVVVRSLRSISSILIGSPLPPSPRTMKTGSWRCFQVPNWCQVIQLVDQPLVWLIDRCPLSSRSSVSAHCELL